MGLERKSFCCNQQKIEVESPTVVNHRNAPKIITNAPNSIWAESLCAILAVPLWRIPPLDKTKQHTKGLPHR